MKQNYRFALKKYEFAGQFVKNKIVLDAGSGSGEGSIVLLRRGAKEVYGVDEDSDAISYCQKNFRRKNLKFSCQSLQNLSYPEDHFDIVVAFDIIEHIYNYKSALKEISRVLKPGGTVLISTPNKRVYSPMSKKPFYPFHFYEFDLFGFKEILKGFKIIQLVGQFIEGQENISPYYPIFFIKGLYANLPFVVKVQILKAYLGLCWLSGKFYLGKNRLGKIYFSSKNINNARSLIAVCQTVKKH